jgi:uncharacterized protein YkwD
MRIAGKASVALLALAGAAILAQSAAAQSGMPARPADMQAQTEQLFALANQARATAGVGSLKWDPALAAAALNHCQRMAAEGPIAHRYGGEPDVGERAAQAGSHFSVIEENVAVGSFAATIHQGWMDSPHHRENLLSPDVDRVGIALVPSRGVLYAVADYAHSVPILSPAQVEASVGGLLKARGVVLALDNTAARAYCSRGSRDGSGPGFLMVWQNADTTVLPQPLLEQLANGRYGKAAVGSCPAKSVEGAFTVYRVAVLLY